jgi:hypothetical protein
MDWMKARMRERSTWAGLILLVGSLLAGPLGFSYADFKDAVLVALFGAGLMATPTGGSNV